MTASPSADIIYGWPLRGGRKGRLSSACGRGGLRGRRGCGSSSSLFIGQDPILPEYSNCSNTECQNMRTAYPLERLFYGFITDMQLDHNSQYTVHNRTKLSPNAIPLNVLHLSCSSSISTPHRIIRDALCESLVVIQG